MSLLSILLLSASLPAVINAACTGFQPVAGYLSGAPNDLTFTRSATRSYIAGERVSCTGSELGTPAQDGFQCNATTCGLSTTPYLNINIETELNITVSDDEAQRVLALVKRDTENLAGPLFNFNRTQTVQINPPYHTCVLEGEVRYYTLTPVQTCTQGILTGCSGDGSLANGTALLACGYEFFSINESNGMGYISQSLYPTATGPTDSAPAPANDTFIENKSVNNELSGASSLALTSWGWALVATAALCTML